MAPLLDNSHFAIIALLLQYANRYFSPIQGKET